MLEAWGYDIQCVGSDSQIRKAVVSVAFCNCHLLYLGIHVDSGDGGVLNDCARGVEDGALDAPVSSALGVTLCRKGKNRDTEENCEPTVGYP